MSADDFEASGTPMVIEGPNGEPFLTLDALEADALREAAKADGVTPLQWLANVADTELALIKAVEPVQNAVINEMLAKGTRR